VSCLVEAFNRILNTTPRSLSSEKSASKLNNPFARSCINQNLLIMARGNAGNHSSNEESDPGAIGIQAQHQLVQVGFYDKSLLYLADRLFIS
jgi:hypothetical protein